MIDMDWKKQKNGFRFTRLARSQAEELASLGSGVRIQPKKDKPDEYVGWIDLEEGGEYGWILDFVERHRPGEEDYGLFVSLVTEIDTDIIRAPRFAMDLSRRAGGVVDFSYTYVEPGEEDEEEQDEV